MRLCVAAVALACTLPGLAGSAVTAKGFGDHGVLHYSFAQAILPLPNGDILLAATSDGRVRVRWRAEDGTYLGSLSAAGPRCIVPEGESEDRCSPHLVLDARGRILVASDSTVERLLPNGTLDRTFGSGGRTTVPGLRATGLAPHSDGSVAVIGGSARLVRMLENGSLDSAFGAGGVVSLPMAPGAVVVQRDGKVIVAGGELARYDARGELDRSYGVDGYAVTGDVRLGALALQPDGRLVGVGGSWGGPVVRLLQNGRLDPSFGSGGIAPRWSPVAGGGDIVERVAVQPDGGIVVQGESYYYQRALWFVHRLHPDGASAGRARAVANTPSPEREDGCIGEAAMALAVQADGKILASGNTCDEPRVVRFTADLSSFDDDGSTLSIARVRKGDVRLARVRDHWVAAVQVSLDHGASLTAAVSPRAGARSLRLLAGSAVGGAVLRKPERWVSAEVGAARRVTVRVVLPAAAVVRGRTLVLDLDAEDDRTRPARLRIRLVAR